MSKVTGKVESMRRDRKGVKVDGQWYSSFSPITDVEWKDEVEFEYEQKGKYANIKGTVRKLASSGGSGNSGGNAGRGGSVSGYSSLGVELGHASNLAMRMMEQRGAGSVGGTLDVGSAEYYKQFMEDTKNIFKVMKGMRAWAETDDGAKEKPRASPVKSEEPDVNFGGVDEDIF